ncbi:hypothetical protein A2U01_0100622, partial [Trifolium medium]|nr:hypothetical protein [Trifolium medium]
MNEEVRTLKVYGNSTNHCYKVEVCEKDLEEAQQNSNQEWMEPEELSNEESAV